jgi:hypothetical protein
MCPGRPDVARKSLDDELGVWVNGAPTAVAVPAEGGARDVSDDESGTFLLRPLTARQTRGGALALEERRACPTKVSLTP